MDLTLLATLKEKLTKSKTFADIWNYFMDHFGDNPEFIALGERFDDPVLETLLTQAAGQLLGRAVNMDNFLVTRLAEYHFLHGGGTIGGKLANVVYFDDIHVGLLTVVMSFSPSETKFVRFTGQQMPTTYRRSKN